MSVDLNLNDKKIEELLEKNLAMTEEIYKMTRSIKRYVTFQKIMSVIYLLLIILPIIAGAIFLPPIIKDLIEQYRSIMGGEMPENFGTSLLKFGNPSDIRNLSPELQALFK